MSTSTPTSINSSIATAPQSSNSGSKTSPSAVNTTTDERETLLLALKLARRAVVLDETYDYNIASRKYAQTVQLLAEVIEKVMLKHTQSKDGAGERNEQDGEGYLADLRRLQAIRDTYAEREQVLKLCKRDDGDLCSSSRPA